jgi:hypothetical protein
LNSFSAFHPKALNIVENGRSPGFPEFAGLLNPMAGSMAMYGQISNRQYRIGLQLRGQLRHYTEFPFNPKFLEIGLGTNLRNKLT